MVRLVEQRESEKMKGLPVPLLLGLLDSPYAETFPYSRDES
jgi:hypothetical protein